METIFQEHDIKVFYITATSFPDGIPAAHEKLHELVSSDSYRISTGRKYFGVSRPENDGPIVYRAAAEEIKKGEAEKLKCDTLILRKGKYISREIQDYAKDIQSISRAFQELLSTPGLDPQGYCVEWYENNKDVKCMIRLDE